MVSCLISKEIADMINFVNTESLQLFFSLVNSFDIFRQTKTRIYAILLFYIWPSPPIVGLPVRDKKKNFIQYSISFYTVSFYHLLPIRHKILMELGRLIPNGPLHNAHVPIFFLRIMNS